MTLLRCPMCGAITEDIPSAEPDPDRTDGTGTSDYLCMDCAGEDAGD